VGVARGRLLTAGATTGQLHGMDTTSFRQRLRAATDPLHRELEATPFFAALAGGEAPGGGAAGDAGAGAGAGGDEAGEVALRSYAGHLEAMRVIYRALEALRPGDIPFPLSALDDDLTSLGDRLPAPGAGGFAPVARVRAQLLAHHLRVLAHRDPRALLGAAYVLEGAGLGARILHPRAVHLFTSAAGEEGGASWLGALAARGPSAWRAFLPELEAAGGDQGAEEAITEAARDTFGHLASVARALHPLQEVPERDREGLVLRELNPLAGVHPVPREAEVLDAALRAGERSWEAWPYYEARYGERGRAFTRSDSAWLVTLASLPRERAVEQIVWLADLLSHRGMPRILMEEHLRILHEELSSESPSSLEGSGDPWRLLLDAAELLEGRRLAVLSERESRGIERRFRARVPAEVACRIPGAGRLLAAALADEADGLPAAVQALEKWLADPERFPDAWVAEVGRTIRAVRKRLLAQA
jgi:heme oxygenase